MSDKVKRKHTENEILSQPAIWRAGLKRSLVQEGTSLPDPADFEQLIFTGCGSTYYLSLWAARLAEESLAIPARAVPASDLLFFSSTWLQPERKTLLVASSRSAETTETIRAVDHFRSISNGSVLAVTCYPERELPQHCDNVISMPDGQEESIAQTRSFTSMMLGIQKWLAGDSRDAAQELPGAASRLITGFQPLSARLGADLSLERFFFLGSGSLYGLACEAMLKMKEMSLSYSEAYHFLEFRHGPKSMVDSTSLVTGFLDDAAADRELAVLREMKELGARILVLSGMSAEKLPDWIDFAVPLGTLPASWRAPLYLPVLQLMALYRAYANGLDPDSPKNLEAVVVLDD